MAKPTLHRRIVDAIEADWRDGNLSEHRAVTLADGHQLMLVFDGAIRDLSPREKTLVACLLVELDRYERERAPAD